MRRTSEQPRFTKINLFSCTRTDVRPNPTAAIVVKSPPFSDYFHIRHILRAQAIQSVAGGCAGLEKYGGTVVDCDAINRRISHIQAVEKNILGIGDRKGALDGGRLPIGCSDFQPNHSIDVDSLIASSNHEDRRADSGRLLERGGNARKLVRIST